MAEVVQLAIEPRDTYGTQRTRRLRKTGKLPGVVYGHKEATVAVSLNREAFENALRHGARLMELTGGDKTESVLVQEVQWDHLGKEVLHVDLRRVSKDERVEVMVPLHLRGIAPGVAAGGVLDQPLHVMQVQCLVTAVPEHIRVNVGEMQVGMVIYVRDLQLPEGVKAMGDPDAIVVQLKAPQVEVEAGLPGAEQAEPEVIGRAKEDAEDEEADK